MRKKVILLGCLIWLGCAPQNSVEPPEQLISPEKMEDVLYDLSLIKALKNTNFQTEESKSILTPDYLFKKHNIDSLQWEETCVTAKIQAVFTDLQESSERYPQVLDSIDTLLLRENKKIISRTSPLV